MYQYKNIAWLNNLRLHLDALDYQWARWVLGYSNKEQNDLLNKLFGKDKKWKTALTVALTLIITMGLITFFYRFDYNLLNRKKITSWLKLYQKVLRKLSMTGLSKPNHMTPSDFAKLVAQQRPEISQEFFKFTDIFESLTYHDLCSIKQDELILQMKNQYVEMKKLKL